MQSATPRTWRCLPAVCLRLHALVAVRPTFQNGVDIRSASERASFLRIASSHWFAISIAEPCPAAAPPWSAGTKSSQRSRPRGPRSLPCTATATDRNALPSVRLPPYQPRTSIGLPSRVTDQRSVLPVDTMTFEPDAVTLTLRPSMSTSPNARPTTLPTERNLPSASVLLSFSRFFAATFALVVEQSSSTSISSLLSVRLL